MPYWKTYYHIIWGTKDRLPLIDMSFEAPLYRIIASKGIELGATVHAIGGTENHIHIAASVPPKLSLAYFVGQLKGTSSHYINHEIRPDRVFAWQHEYGVVTFGQNDLPEILAYIRNQKNHHHEKKIRADLELL